jgi:hypothetical protein
VDEQQPGLDVIRIRHPINDDGDLGHAISSPGEQDFFLGTYSSVHIPQANLELPGPFAPVLSRVPILYTTEQTPAQRRAEPLDFLLETNRSNQWLRR